MINLCMLLLITINVIVITRRNPMVSLIFLVAFYVTLAWLLFMLDLAFLSMFYIIIYVGAITILFIFIISLINISMNEIYYKSMSVNDLSLIGLSFFAIYFFVSLHFGLSTTCDQIEICQYFDTDILELKVIGETLYVSYAIVFLMLAMLLLVTVVSVLVVLL